MKIGFYGMTHLGLNYLAASAQKGFEVIGYDNNTSVINKLKSNIKIIREPGLFQALKKNRKKIKFSNNFLDFNKCEIIFMSSDIKTDKNGKSNLLDIKINIKNLKKKFKNKNLVILSQVYPGFTSKVDWNNEKLFYQVETLIFGKALNRALFPERIILGMKNPKSNINNHLNKYFTKFNCPIIKTNFTTAELIKISINIFLISSISTTNILANFAKKIGASWEHIEQSLRLDKRIGKYAYLKPGLGISGGNLERDLYNITSISKKINFNYQLFSLWKQISNKQKNLLFKIINKINSFKSSRVGILGLAYKENTDSIKNSISLDLIKKYKNKIFYGYDPGVKKLNLKNLILLSNMERIYKNIDILFILTPWNEFKKIPFKKIKKNKIKIIVDLYSVLSNYEIKFKKNKIKYITLNS